MRRVRKASVPVAVIVLFCAVLSTQMICFGAQAEASRKLTSFKTGFFYLAASKGEGMVQLSACGELKEAVKASFKKPFACVPEGKGFRCTAKESLDVIFLFTDMKECIADRTATLSSEDE